MARFDPRLLPPDDDELDLPQYRPVWRTAFREMGILAALALVLLLLGGGLDLSPAERMLASGALALLPLGLWLVFSWRGEQRVREPRPYLLRVLALSALVTNAVTAPFVEGLVEPGRWLTTTPLVERIIGTMLAIGLVTEFSKYAVLRGLVWPRQFRQRSDAVAYSLTASLGVAVVLGLRYAILDGGGQPGAAAVHIVSLTLMQQAIGLITGLGMVALQRTNVRVLSFPLYLLGAAVLHGVYAVIRAGMVVRGFGIAAAGSSPLFGLGFGVIFAAIMYVTVAFLINTADTRDSQLASGPGVVRFARPGK